MGWAESQEGLIKSTSSSSFGSTLSQTSFMLGNRSKKHVDQHQIIRQPF